MGAAASPRTGLHGCRASVRLDEVCTALRLLVAPPFGAVRVPLYAVRDAAELAQHTRARRVLAPLPKAWCTAAMVPWCMGWRAGCTGLRAGYKGPVWVHGVAARGCARGCGLQAAGCRLHLQRVPPAMAVPSLPVPRLGPRAGVGMHVDGVAAVVPRAATATRAPVDPEGCSPLPASPPGLQPRRYIARGEGPARDVRDEPAALVEAAQRGERGGDGVLAPRFVEEDPQHDTRRPPGWG